MNCDQNLKHGNGTFEGRKMAIEGQISATIG